MEDIKTNSLPVMECGMAYLAHPYSPIAENLKVFTGEIKESNVEETDILRYDFRLLSKCTHLILSGYWRLSKGCMSEYGYAVAKGIRIYEYRDSLLYPLE